MLVGFWSSGIEAEQVNLRFFLLTVETALAKVSWRVLCLRLMVPGPDGEL